MYFEPFTITLLSNRFKKNTKKKKTFPIVPLFQTWTTTTKTTSIFTVNNAHTPTPIHLHSIAHVDTHKVEKWNTKVPSDVRYDLWGNPISCKIVYKCSTTTTTTPQTICLQSNTTWSIHIWIHLNPQQLVDGMTYSNWSIQFCAIWTMLDIELFGGCGNYYRHFDGYDAFFNLIYH